MNIRPAVVVAAGVPVLVALARNLEFLGRDYGSVLHPVSVHVVLPFMFGAPPVLVLLVWMAAFYGWNVRLFLGAATTPLRTLRLWSLVTVLSLVNYVFSWPYGLRHQGVDTMVTWLLLSVVLCIVSGLLLRESRGAPSFARALAGHTTLWFWMTSVAVPWLGEML